MARLFPPVPSGSFGYKSPVRVYMDLTDLKELKPSLIIPKLKQIIWDEGHGVWFSMDAFFMDGTIPEDRVSEYRDWGIVIRRLDRGKKETIMNMMLTRALFWTLNHGLSVSGLRRELEPVRVLLLSKNIDDPNISVVCTCLEKLGCVVVSAIPDTLISYQTEVV